MIDSDFFVQCKQWQRNVNSAMDIIIDKACGVPDEKTLHTALNALSILAKEFGEIIPITPETMEAYKSKQEVFNLQVDVDFEKHEIRIIRNNIKVRDENSSNG